MYVMCEFSVRRVNGIRQNVFGMKEEKHSVRWRDNSETIKD